MTTAFGTGTSVGTYTVNPSPAQPSLVTATPTSICEGSSANINATSVGNTINWYTVPFRGVAIGNTASGANLLVTPANTTTYYAESAAPGIAVTTFNYTGGVYKLILYL
ncbi:MAG: hypothetical protein IPI22_11210 [Bacteroidetes bacterium]|nr:hypothetical protein [Bacteroidota bacterium]